MHSPRIADSEQLAMLARVLDDHCQAAGVGCGSLERERIAARIMTLYNSGGDSVEELKAALDADPGHQVHRYSQGL